MKRIERASYLLRWNGDVLEQMWLTMRIDDRGRCIEAGNEWRPVPRPIPDGYGDEKIIVEKLFATAA